MLDRILFDLLLECWCSALLPPCPDPVPSDCVPLAVVTIQRGRDCRVVEICNWEARKFAVTLPSIFYWLPRTLFAQIRAAVQRLCCQPNRKIDALAASGSVVNTLRMKSAVSATAGRPVVAQPAAAGPAVSTAGASAAAGSMASGGPSGGGPSEEPFDFDAMLDRLLAGDEELYRQVLDNAEVGPLAALSQVANAPDGLRGMLAPIVAMVNGAGVAAPHARKRRRVPPTSPSCAGRSPISPAG